MEASQGPQRPNNSKSKQRKKPQARYWKPKPPISSLGTTSVPIPGTGQIATPDLVEPDASHCQNVDGLVMNVVSQPESKARLNQNKGHNVGFSHEPLANTNMAIEMKDKSTTLRVQNKTALDRKIDGHADTHSPHHDVGVDDNLRNVHQAAGTAGKPQLTPHNLLETPHQAKNASSSTSMLEPGASTRKKNKRASWKSKHQDLAVETAIHHSVFVKAANGIGKGSPCNTVKPMVGVDELERTERHNPDQYNHPQQRHGCGIVDKDSGKLARAAVTNPGRTKDGKTPVGPTARIKGNERLNLNTTQQPNITSDRPTGDNRHCQRKKKLGKPDVLSVNENFKGRSVTIEDIARRTPTPSAQEAAFSINNARPLAADISTGSTLYTAGCNRCHQTGITCEHMLTEDCKLPFQRSSEAEKSREPISHQLLNTSTAPSTAGESKPALRSTSSPNPFILTLPDITALAPKSSSHSYQETSLRVSSAHDQNLQDGFSQIVSDTITGSSSLTAKCTTVQYKLSSCKVTVIRIRTAKSETNIAHVNKGTFVPQDHRVTRSVSEYLPHDLDLQDHFRIFEHTMFDLDFAARRGVWAERVKGGYYGRPKGSAITLAGPAITSAVTTSPTPEQYLLEFSNPTNLNPVRGYVSSHSRYAIYGGSSTLICSSSSSSGNTSSQDSLPLHSRGLNHSRVNAYPDASSLRSPDIETAHGERSVISLLSKHILDERTQDHGKIIDIPPDLRALPPHIRLLFDSHEPTIPDSRKAKAMNVSTNIETRAAITDEISRSPEEKKAVVLSSSKPEQKSVAMTVAPTGANVRSAGSKLTYAEPLYQDQRKFSAAISTKSGILSLSRHPDEVFIPPGPKRLKPPIDFEQLLPERYRNMIKPQWMVERDAKRAAEASKNPPPTEEELWQRVIERNENAYRPVIDLGTRQCLDFELAGDETPVRTDVVQVMAHDLSASSPRGDASQQAANGVEQAVHWRWFKEIETSQHSRSSGKHDGEKKTLENDLAYPNGKWVPVTLDWLDREQFVMTKKQVAQMDKWLSERVTEALEDPFKVDTSDPDWLSGDLPASGTGKQWQSFPSDTWFRRRPMQYGPMDWTMVETLPPMKDPYSLVAERRVQCSATSAKAWCIEFEAAEKKRADEKERKRLEVEQEKETVQERKARKEAEFQKHQQYRAELFAQLTPKANIYIRPAMLAHVPQITAIYNHYVRNSVHAEELEATHVRDWRDRLNGAGDDNLAFLVAILKSNKAAGRRKHRHQGAQRDAGGAATRSREAVNVYSENVVGFAFSEWIAGKSSMYRHTAELHLYVDPNHARQGVGRTLMDRIMGSLDEAYLPMAVTGFIVERDAKLAKAWYSGGGSKEVHKIQVNINYCYGEEQEMEWRKKWLESWEFDHVATLSCIGHKFNKGVNTIIMLKETAMTTTGVSTWYPDEPARFPYRERMILAAEAQAGEDAAQRLLL